MTAPRWAGQLTSAASNALIGGITAGLYQELRGGSFKDGFTRGALGGSLTYAGKHIAGRKFDGAGLIGRQVSAVGNSIVRNASEARPMFEQVVLPIGTLRVHLLPLQRKFSHVSVDLVATGWTVWAAFESELELDLDESLSAGTPVFNTDNKIIVYGSSRVHATGVTAAGVIMRSRVPAYGKPLLARVMSHERVHVLQEDHIYHTLLAPAETWLLGKLPRGRTIERYIDLNGSTEVIGLLTPLFPRHADRPWELEAIYLSR